MTSRTVKSMAWTATLLAVVFAVVSFLPEAYSSRRPNVILILTDDQGYGDVGVHGNDVLRTPNLDRLAREGVRIKEFYVTPLCATTRASLLTGRYNQRTGVLWPFLGAEVLRHREVTLAEALKDAGYQTALIGKWHLGRYGKYGPLTHGFDEFLGFRDGMIDDYFDTPLEHNGLPARISNYITDALTDAALRFVESNRSRPFFLFLSYNAPHIPNQVPLKYEQEYTEKGLSPHLAKVYGMITCLDDGIGRVLEALEKLGLEENTIVVFLSDNGPQMESSRQMQQFRSREWHRMDAMWKGVGRYNANLRGEKATVYEGGIRSPFFARWVGQLPAGKTLDLAASHIDLLPTLLDLCEVPLPEGPALDGRSLAPLLNSPWQKSSRHSTVPASRRTALRFGHILPVCTRIAPCPAGAGTVSVLAGLSPRTVKAGRGDPPDRTLFFWSDAPKTGVGPRLGLNRRNYAVRRGPWKLVGGQELFDLSRDPYEQKNLAERQPGRVKELQEAFDRWAQEVVPIGDLVRLPVPVTGEDTPSIMSNVFRGGTVIDIAWARLHGQGLRYGYDKLIRDKITGWEDPNDFIRWHLDVGRAGRYEVILQYGCGVADAGSRIRIASGDARIEFVVEPTSAVDVWRTQGVGFLGLKPGLTTLDIRVLSKGYYKTYLAVLSGGCSVPGCEKFCDLCSTSTICMNSPVGCSLLAVSGRLLVASGVSWK